MNTMGATTYNRIGIGTQYVEQQISQKEKIRKRETMGGTTHIRERI